jgi:hypothetical protein
MEAKRAEGKVWIELSYLSAKMDIVDFRQSGEQTWKG